MSSTAERIARRAVQVCAGLGFGALTAFGELTFLLLTSPALLTAGSRAGVLAGARTIAELERARVTRFLGGRYSDDFGAARAWRYLLLRCVVGSLGAGVLLLIALGSAGGMVMVGQLLSGVPIGGGEESDWYDPITLLLGGTLLFFLAVQGLRGVASLDRALARRFFGPSDKERLRRRVQELATTRAEVVEAVNTERKRIERDLHDGVQQRLVALGMVLGRARRASDPHALEELVTQAHEEAQTALRELREVAWRVYPVALDSGGLEVALESLAERSTVPTTLSCLLVERPDVATETVAYFVVSEAVTNALKHGECSRIDIRVERAGATLVVGVRDDGTGGADVEGTGLSGLARRVAAADGVFAVDSPPGGPTVVRAELPCG